AYQTASVFNGRMKVDLISEKGSGGGRYVQAQAAKFHCGPRFCLVVWNDLASAEWTGPGRGSELRHNYSQRNDSRRIRTSAIRGGYRDTERHHCAHRRLG